MKHNRWLPAPAAVVAVSVCGGWMTESCSRSPACAAALTYPKLLPVLALTAALVLFGSTLLAWLLRALWLMSATALGVRRLSLQDWPAGLREAAKRTGAQHVHCIAGEAPLAFCAGILRPSIFVTSGLVAYLRAGELDAVLLHERHHSRRHDPLRQALRQSAADVCFYLPLLRWWARYQYENAELRADRAALQGAGRRPLAGALWAVAAVSTPHGVATFHGSAELRVAQVLDDPLPRRGPSFSLWLTSAAGCLSALGLTWCLSQVLVVLR